MKNSSGVNVVLAVALAVSLTVNLLLCFLWPDESQDAPSTDSSQTTTTAPLEQKVMTEIQVPYGTLQYPSEYIEYLDSRAVEENGMYMQVFSYRHGEETIEMFRVHFGVQEVPAVFGTVSHHGEEIEVGISSTDFMPDESWSMEEQDRFRAMSMAVNDVIASVQAWENYVG